MAEFPTVGEVVAAVNVNKIFRGQAKQPRPIPNSMPANVIGLTWYIPFAAMTFSLLFWAAFTERPGALLPLFLFGGFAVGTIAALAIGTFHPTATLLDNFFVKWVVAPTGAGVLLFLVGGGLILAVLAVLQWLFR